MAVNCDNISISIEELLNSLLVKDIAGNYGLRTVRVSAAAANIESVRQCEGNNLTLEQIARYVIGVSDDGKPAIILIEET
jgi:hypothetical protein